jgi:hypothetical protein
MKTLKPTLGLLILITLASGNCLAQKSIYTTNGGIAIGFGGGLAYQKSDLANSKGYGFDFIFGSQLYKRENAFLSVDWKFRFLAGGNKAYDHRINTDDTYSNIRYSFFTYDLELGLTLNRLRERTRIVLSGFAGAGITHGRTFTDLYNAERSLYDFSSIDPNLDSKTIYTDLRTLSDGDFETALVNKAAVLPTAGLFLGYQFSRSFSMGVEFKTNFYLTEYNSFVSIDLDNRVLSGSGIDRNSYVSLGFRWKLGGGSSRYSAVHASSQPVPHSTEIYNEPETVSLPNPSVVITDPNTESLVTASSTHTLWALVNHVSGPEHISLYQNGFPIPEFTYNTSTKILIANLLLHAGENVIRVQATNQSAQAEDQVFIILDPAAGAEEIGVQVDIPPGQQGAYTPKTYVPGSGSGHTGSVQVNVNYNPTYTGYYQTGISQDRARIEVVEVPADPVAVSAPERVPVNYDRPAVRTSPVTREPCAPPKVSLALNQVNRPDASHEISASVVGVKNKADISLTLNGKAYRAFQYVPTRGDLSAKFKLTPGLHTIVVSVNNACGTDSKSVSVGRDIPCVSPAVNLDLIEVNRTDATHEISGKISGVKTKADISLILDGKAHNGFQFLPSTGDLSARFKLTPGSHTIVVQATNACGQGSDSESVHIEEEASGPRINPGNSDWQFCLVTPSGTFSRDQLSNPNFSYNGPASSLYFLPIAGGGDVLVNGRPYSIRSGQYYLFTGDLKVNVSTKNPGSMGHWSVDVQANRVPVTGNGNNRPKSPCEAEQTDNYKDKAGKKPKTNPNNGSKASTDSSPRVNTGYSPRVNTGRSPKAASGTSPKATSGNSSKATTGTSPNTNNVSRSRASTNQRSSRDAGDRTQGTRSRR